MSRLRALLATPIVSDRNTPYLIRYVLNGIGVFTFLFGAFSLQYLEPTRVEAVFGLLLLGNVTLTLAGLGQLAVIAARLERQAEPVADPERVG